MPSKRGGEALEYLWKNVHITWNKHFDVYNDDGSMIFTFFQRYSNLKFAHLHRVYLAFEKKHAKEHSKEAEKKKYVGTELRHKFKFYFMKLKIQI